MNRAARMLRSLLRQPTRWPLAGPQQAARDAGWMPDPPSAYCFRCGATVADEAVKTDGCPFCAGRSLPWQRLIRLHAYTQPLSGWITAMKFAGAWWYAPWLGERLAERLAPVIDGPCIVCPVPMPRLRRWRRGYNQAFLMAEALASVRGWPIERLLCRTRYTAPQTSVAPSRRVANVRGALSMRRPLNLAGWTVCLVDDIKTTGATAGACAAELHKAGAKNIVLAVAAVADPRGRDFKHTA